MRHDWDRYFMSIAIQVATRATCDRKHVGALLVRNRMMLSSGYNGSVRGLPHCDDVGHMMEDGHCVATIHAEANAIIQAARNGVGIEGATLYCTASPCWPCFKMIANAGITRICYGEFYRDDRIFTVAQDLAIELVRVATGGDALARADDLVQVPRSALDVVSRAARELYDQPGCDQSEILLALNALEASPRPPQSGGRPE